MQYTLFGYGGADRAPRGYTEGSTSGVLTFHRRRFSAFGCTTADYQHRYALRSSRLAAGRRRAGQAVVAEAVNRVWEEMEEAARAEMPPRSPSAATSASRSSPWCVTAVS
jgi:N-methylhydantoinase A/oxoprolinase/acetone carboxylase beta subunit